MQTFICFLQTEKVLIPSNVAYIHESDIHLFLNIH